MSTKSRFHFSLRESMLAMIAAAALLALAVKSFEKPQPFIQTGLFEELGAGGAKTLVKDICQELGMDVQPSGASASGSDGENSVSLELHITLDTLPDSSAGVVAALQGKVQEILAKDGCAVVSTGATTRGDEKRITRFSISYEKEATRGHVSVHRIPSSTDSLSLFIMIHEFGT